MAVRDQGSGSIGLLDNVNGQPETIFRSENPQELWIGQKYLQYHQEKIDYFDYFRPYDFRGASIEGLRRLATQHTFVFDAVAAFSALIYSIREAPEVRHHADEFYGKALAGLRVAIGSDNLSGASLAATLQLSTFEVTFLSPAPTDSSGTAAGSRQAQNIYSPRLVSYLPGWKISRLFRQIR